MTVLVCFLRQFCVRNRTWIWKSRNGGEKKNRDLLASEVVGMGLFCLKNHRVGCCQQPLRVSHLAEEPKIHEGSLRSSPGCLMRCLWLGLELIKQQLAGAGECGQICEWGSLWPSRAEGSELELLGSELAEEDWRIKSRDSSMQLSRMSLCLGSAFLGTEFHRE